MPDSPEIKVTLTAEDQGLSAALRELSSQLKNVKTQQEETASSSLKLGDAFRYLLEYLAVDRLIEYGKGVMDAAVQMGALSRNIGVSSSTLSVFRHVSEETGVSWERISRSLAMGARRITEFLGGQQQAAEGMKLLNLTTSDFIGLNPDQKLALMVTALGRMPDGFNKAAASQMLFSRGGKDLVTVANAIAAQGFSKIEGELARTGVLMDKDFTDKATIAQAALHNLEDVAAGVTVEFESGFLPALGDIYDGLEGVNKASDDTAKSLQAIGRAAGDIVKGIIAGFGIIGSVFEQIGSDLELISQLALHTFEELGRAAIAAADAMSLHFSAAREQLRGGLDSFQGDIKRFWDENKSLVEDNKNFIKGLFPSASEEASRIAEWKKMLALDQPTGDSDVPYLGQFTKKGPPEDANKAALALSLKLQQDLLEVWKTGAEQRTEVEKEAYEKGTLNLKTYFADRRATLQEETAKEIEALKAEREQVQQASEAASGRASAAQASFAKLGSHARPQDRQAAEEAVDKALAEHLQLIGRIDELDTKISTAEISSRTKLIQLDAEQFAAEREQKEKILGFMREIERLQGNTNAGAGDEAEAKIEHMRAVLDQAKGQNIGGVKLDSTGIDSLIAKYRQLTQAVATFGDEQKDIELGIRRLDLERNQIDAGAGSPGQYLALLRQQIPLLQKKAQLELAAAQTSGDEGRILEAQQTILELQKLAQQMDATKNVLHDFAGGLTNDFNRFFEAIPKGAQGMTQAFGQMELAVIRSLENIGAQMLANLAVSLLTDDTQRISSARTAAVNTFKNVSNIPVIGWILAPIAAAEAFAQAMAFAKGGLVEGPGGPTADLIPARLSAGEFVMNAGAVRSFGAHNLEAINAGVASTSPSFAASIAHPSDFRAPSFQLPDSVAANAGGVHNDVEINLHHNGPDAREVLESELVPLLTNALRMGALPSFG